MENISRKIAAGAAWMLLLRGLHRSLGVISTIVLARMLSPDDFGLVAMATAVWALLQLMGAFSFDVALIRDPNATRADFDTVWTITVLVGLAVGASLCLLAVPASHFYSDPRLPPIMYVLALGAAISAFSNVGVVWFRKDLDFRKEFYYVMGCRLVPFLVTVPLAIWLRNYWAMVLGTLAGAIGGVLLSYRAHPYRPRFSLARVSALMSFSSWLFVNNLFLFLYTRSVDLILGRLYGARSLGLYNVGNEIATLPTTELLAPINRAVFPAYAKLAADLGALRREFLRVFSMSVMLSAPAAVGLAATAPLIVTAVLGEKWLGAIPIIQILAFHGMLAAVASNNGMVYLAVGRPKIPAVLLGACLVFMIPAIWFGASRYGAEGAALAVLATSVLSMPLSMAIVIRLLEVPAREFLRRAWRPMLSAATMGVPVHLLTVHWLPQASGATGVAVLLGTVSAGILLYGSVLGLLWLVAGRPPGAERYLLDKSVAFVRSRARGARPGSEREDGVS